MTSQKDLDKKTVESMIRLYCKHQLKTEELPEKYQELIHYANHRLDHCSWGKEKPPCKDCPHHCYAPEQRREIRKIMRWAGPRMLFWSPKAAFRHLIQVLYTRTSRRFKHVTRTGR